MRSKSSVLYSILPVAGLLIFGGCSQAPEVEAVQPERGEMYEFFREPAQTRLQDTWVISMPVAGLIGRIGLEPGDPVKKGELLVPFDTAPLDLAVTEARAAVEEFKANINVIENDALENTILEQTHYYITAAEDALKASDAQIEAQQKRTDRLVAERVRQEELYEENAISQSRIDDARLDAEVSLIDLREQELTRAIMNTMLAITRMGPQSVEDYLTREKLEERAVAQQLVQAEARLALAEHRRRLADIVSPIDGVVLERYERGGQPFPEGQKLLLLGNLEQLEVVVDVLSEDALRLSVGSTVAMAASSINKVYSGKVKRIEPAGFTKLSSLGVEQQRVNVIVEFTEPPSALGTGYRLNAMFKTAEKPDAIKVPRYSVLEDTEGFPYVLKITENKLRKERVKIGLENDLWIEILEGVTEDDLIVAVPDASMNDGDRVKSKERPA